MQHLAAIAVAGAVGALCRHGINIVCIRWLEAHQAWATFTVNMTGSLLLGFFVAMPLAQNSLAAAAIAVGFLGAFTTFSTFSLETVRLFQSGQSSLALLNIAGSVLLGLTAVYAGMNLGRWLAG